MKITIDSMIRIENPPDILRRDLRQFLRIELPEKVELRKRLLWLGLRQGMVKLVFRPDTTFENILYILTNQRKAREAALTKPRKGGTKRDQALVKRIMRIRGMDDWVLATTWAEDPPELSISRGCWEHVWGVIKDLPHTLHWHWQEGSVHLYQSDWVMRDYQKVAVAAAVAATGGLIVGPCGSGKTVMGLEIVRRLGRHALILVHTTALLDQWERAIEAQLGLVAGVFGDGQERPGEIAIAITQTMTRREKLPGWLDNVGVLIVDECHHIPARTIRALVERLPAARRYGMTATAWREDGYTEFIGWVMGPTLHEIPIEELYKAGVIMRPIIHRCLTGYHQHVINPGENWAGFLTELSEAERRTRKITDFIAQNHRHHQLGLVTVARVAMANEIAGWLAELGIKARPLHAKLRKKERRETMRALRAAELEIVVATTVIGEGLDVDAFDSLYIASPFRSMTAIIQWLGRIQRIRVGKTSVHVYDFVDDIRTLTRQWYARMAGYRTIHCDFGDPVKMGF